MNGSAAAALSTTLAASDKLALRATRRGASATLYPVWVVGIDAKGDLIGMSGEVVWT